MQPAGRCSIPLKPRAFLSPPGPAGALNLMGRQFHVPKTHALDAACVGVIGEIREWNQPTLAIKATGRGSYQRTRLNADGFPRGYLTRQKRIKGFQTGYLVKAEVTKGTKIGAYLGRVAVRASGSFNLQTAQGVIQGFGYQHCKVIQCADGYGYWQQLNPKEAELRSAHSTSPA